MNLLRPLRFLNFRVGVLLPKNESRRPIFTSTSFAERVMHRNDRREKRRFCSFALISTISMRVRVKSLLAPTTIQCRYTRAGGSIAH